MSFLRAVLASSALLVVGTSCTGSGARGGSNAGDPSVPEGTTSVSFDTSQALSLGSGCPDKNLDVDVTATTTGLHLSFRQLRIDLAAGDTQLSGLLACSVRVPFRAPSGHRVASVRGRLVYGVDKSADASGMASSAVILSATPTPLVSIEVPRGAAMSIPALTYENHVQVDAACGASGILGINVNLSGRKEGAGEAMHLSIASFDLDIELAPCP